MYVVKYMTNKTDKDVLLMYTFQEKLLLKGFKNSLNFHIGGLLNSIEDGDYTPEEFKAWVTMPNLEQFLQDELNEAYKKGYYSIESNSGIIVEAKHFKFLGNEKLLELKYIAAATILIDSDVKRILNS